eukprot:EG_transcript_12825
MASVVGTPLVNNATPRLSSRVEMPEPGSARTARSARASVVDTLDIQRAVVAVPADAVAAVAEGSVVDDPSRSALLLLKEQFSPFTTFRAQSRRFVVHAKLGEGQSSVVFQVEDCVEDRYVALKMVPLTGAYTEETYATAALLKRLNHEHIVPCWDFFEYTTSGVSFLCLKVPFCPRGSLADLIHWKNYSGSKINSRHIVSYISQLAAVLLYLHQQGLLHGDLRPEHVLLYLHKEEVRVIGLADNLGLRRRCQGAASVTGGRLLYVPPEWAHSPFLGRKLHPQETPLPSYDMWTLGCLLAELCTGKTLEDRLGPHGTPLATNAPILEAVLQQMQTAHKGVFEPLCRGLLDPDPDTRLDPEGVQEALKEVKAKLGSIAGTLSKPFKLLKSKS